jgi:tetratricopeptide (TPR) repeat protein
MNERLQSAALIDGPELAADSQHPWLGLAFFTEETRGYFYGREEEIAELARRVRRKTLTVLFGQSGLGKTSILRAGIVPRLRPEGFCPVYVRIDYSEGAPAPSEQIKQAIFRTTQASGQWTQTGVAQAGESLWEFLHHRDDMLRDEQGKVLIPLLIFDQFEEIFTLAQNDDFGRRRAAEFIEDLADLVENRSPKALEAKMESDDAAAERFDFARSDYRILIALREDYLAHLESFRGVMPSIAANRMRLARMTGAQALEAVTRPGGALVSEEVAAAIVRFVAGGTELTNAEVEPSLLSLICLELNNARIAQGRSEIGTDLLAGSHAGILNEFYERALADQPAGVRRVIEDQLLTEGGFRESLTEERLKKAFASADAAPDALAKLVDRRLLRIEERLDVRRVELTHDVLCGVVKSSRDLRLEREARDQAEQRLQAQRERERATRRALVRARQIAIGCGLLAVVAVAASVFGYINMTRAQHTRAMAESARVQAEKLVVYLLDDFQLELEPVGRLDIVAELARRSIDYYKALPAELRSDDSDRNRALAQLRYGAVLRRQEKLDEARPILDDAVTTLERLSRGAGTSELTTIGLAQGHGTRALLHGLEGDFKPALVESERAVQILKPVAESTAGSAAARRAYGLVLNQYGFIQMRNGLFEDAALSFERSRSVYRSMDDFNVKDSASAAGYLEPSSWLVEDLFHLAKDDQAMQVGAEALLVADQVLEGRPGHLLVLRAKALIYDSMAQAASDLLQWQRVLALTTQAQQTWTAMLQIDPGNEISRYNRGVSRWGNADALEQMGRPVEAVRMRALVIQGFSERADRGSLGGRADNAREISELYEALGEPQAADKAIAQSRNWAAQALKLWPEGSFWHSMTQLYLGDALLLKHRQMRGEHEVVLRDAPTFGARVMKLPPDSGFARYYQGQWARALYAMAAQSALALGDFTRTEEYSLRAIEAAALTDPRNVSDLRPIDECRALRALALARLGRQAEAQAELAPVLQRQRALMAKGKEDQRLRVELARSLLASSYVEPASAIPDLQQAQSLMAGLSAEMHGLKTVAFWQARIDEALQAHRRGS